MKRFSHTDHSSEHLDLLLATSEIGIWELDAETGDARRNLRHDQIFGHDQLLDHWSGEIFLTYVHEEDRGRVSALLDAALKEGKPWSFETRIRRADGVDRWISAKGLPKLSDTGEVTKLIGHVIDITETKQSEDRLKLLTKELNHRVSNTFTIVNSMIRHAAKKTVTVDQFADTLLERLAALSRSNKVLITEEAERSSLREILDMELEAFSNWRSRIAIDGNTTVWFSGEASEALSMIFHELLTNALKHGALSVPVGKISVAITRGASGEVQIKWVETDGPSLTGDRRIGIGSAILQNALREEGSVALDFTPRGLACEITVNDSFQRPEKNPPKPQLTVSIDQHDGTDASFSGKRILVVEDDPIIGLDIADILATRGAAVLGPFSTTTSALEAIRERPDAALLDINLGQETSETIALRLSDLSVPFLILSGQVGTSDLEDIFKGAPLISKPFRERDLVSAFINLT